MDGFGSERYLSGEHWLLACFVSARMEEWDAADDAEAGLAFWTKLRILAELQEALAREPLH